MATATPVPFVGRVNYQRRFGRRLKALREAAGMSQAEVADEAGLTRPYLSNLERGRANPTLDVVLRIQRALGLASVEQLLSGLRRWGSDELADNLL